MREHIGIADRPRASPALVAYRTTFPARFLRSADVGLPRTKWWGADRHMGGLSRYGDPRRDFVTSQPERAEWITAKSWSTKGDVGELRAAFKDFRPDALAVLAAAPAVYKWGMLERDPLPTWRRGRAVLLGDACHPMTPYLASGAAMALEDPGRAGALLRGDGGREPRADVRGLRADAQAAHLAGERLARAPTCGCAAPPIPTGSTTTMPGRRRSPPQSRRDRLSMMTGHRRHRYRVCPRHREG